MKKIEEFFKKNMTLLLTLVAVSLVIVGVFFLSKLGEDKYFKEIPFSEYKNYVNKDNAFVFFGSKEDEEAFNIVSSIANSNALRFKYVYTDSLTEEEKKEVLNETSSSKIIYNGQELDDITALDVQKFLMENEVIPTSMLKVTMDQYEELMKEENFVVVVVQEGCSFCEKFKPVVNEVIEEYDLPIYYVDTYYFDEEDYNRLVDSAAYFSEEDWGTPTTVVFNKGKVVDVQGGYRDKDTFVNFLKNAKVIK